MLCTFSPLTATYKHDHDTSQMLWEIALETTLYDTTTSTCRGIGISNVYHSLPRLYHKSVRGIIA